MAEKRLQPTRGAKTIRRVLETHHGLESPPVVGTVGEVLKREIREIVRSGGDGALEDLGKIDQRILSPTAS